MTERTRVLELDRVTMRFGGVTALSAVDLKVDEGEILGLIGPNGAGKTSLFNSIGGACTAVAIAPVALPMPKPISTTSGAVRPNAAASSPTGRASTRSAINRSSSLDAGSQTSATGPLLAPSRSAIVIECLRSSFTSSASAFSRSPPTPCCARRNTFKSRVRMVSLSVMRIGQC